MAIRLPALALVLVGCFLVPGEIHADQAGVEERRAQVVARVGPSVLRVGDVEDRFAELPPFQRATFGDSPAAARRRFLTDVLVTERLFAVAARAQKLDERPSTAYAIERALSSATIRAIRARVGPASSVPLDDVRRYYDEHRSRYEVPERYQLWRILCKSRDEAEAVLDAAKREPTPAVFGDLARDHSLDKATRLRAGNLGFVTLEGVSNEPGLRVDATLVHAAQSVRDGELVSTPVVEGEYFSVVWRRGTIAPRKHSMDDMAASIRDTLWKARIKDATDKLVASLRSTKLRDLDASLLETLDLPMTDDVATRAPSARRGESDATR